MTTKAQKIILQQVKYLLAATYSSPTPERRDTLITWIRELLDPLVKNKVPEAMYLSTRLPYEEDGSIVFSSCRDTMLDTIIYAAKGGCKEAQYQYACQLYEQGNSSDAIRLYKKSADKGFAPAQWCYGIDKLHGIGCRKSVPEGIKYIQSAAAQKNTFAMDFLIRAYRDGAYGFSKNLPEAKKLARISKESMFESEDLI